MPNFIGTNFAQHFVLSIPAHRNKCIHIECQGVAIINSRLRPIPTFAILMGYMLSSFDLAGL